MPSTKARGAPRLPFGVADYPPTRARVLGESFNALGQVFAAHGYQRVITPLFELESVLARGLGAATADAVFRMVDPASGEVVVLSPDFTAQVARLVASRLAGRPRPLRLEYQGRVARAADPLGRGLPRRDLFQAGIELIGAADETADLEVLALTAKAFARLGRPITIDLSHAAVCAALLPAGEQGLEARAALAAKDPAWLSKAGPALLPLLDLYGSPDLIGRARVALAAAGPGVAAALDRLERVARAFAHKAGPDVRVTLDLGEVRSLGYYTGIFFHGYVEGAADAVVAGGRYDDLLAAFGPGEPAVGLAVDVGALAASDPRPAQSYGVVIAGRPDDPAAEAEAEVRRAGGEPAVVVEAASARAYARAAGFRAVIERSAQGWAESPASPS